MKQRLEPITEAWTGFAVEFLSRPGRGAGAARRESSRTILFLCPAAEKNPTELCLALFGPQIQIHELATGENGAGRHRPGLIFVYAAESGASLKPMLEHYQEQLHVPALVAQRSNLQKSAQHVLEFLSRPDGEDADAEATADLESAAAPAGASAHLEPGIAPLPADAALWSGPLPEVRLENVEAGKEISAKPEINDYRAEYTCRFVLKNFRQPVNRDLMAEMVSLSPGYFSNLFRNEVGMSFSDYLIQIRVNNAKKLLRRFDLSIEEISKLCGFNSLAHFSRTFKERCGVSPLKFRKSPHPES